MKLFIYFTIIFFNSASPMFKKDYIKNIIDQFRYFISHEIELCFILAGECGELVKRKMAKYGVDTDHMQCISQTRGKKKAISSNLSLKSFYSNSKTNTFRAFYSCYQSAALAVLPSAPGWQWN